MSAVFALAPSRARCAALLLCVTLLCVMSLCVTGHPSAEVSRSSYSNDARTRTTRYHDARYDNAAPSRKYRAAGSDEGQAYWRGLGQEELKTSLTMKQNTNVAKNVVLFLGDGMSIATLTAARIYKGQTIDGVSGEEMRLLFEEFPHLGLSKTYSVNKQVPDSASTATAYLTGVKTNYKVVGVDNTVVLGDCTTVTEGSKLDSIAAWALDAGKWAGFVTTTSVSHATPSGLYAHSAHRDWDCDAEVDEETAAACPAFKDIARQLVEDQPGRSFHVVMGGGFQQLSSNATDRHGDLIDVGECVREDSRDLFQDWQDQKEAEGKRFAAVRSKTELMDLDLNGVEHLLGVFANNHLPFEYEAREEPDLHDAPTLAQMTARALDVLGQSETGFFLLVEGGRIDHGHHDNTAHIALDETLGMEAAVAVALAKLNVEESLIVVTADHSHTMVINGYPDRGQDITGFASYGDDDLLYTTLMYTNGPGFSYTAYNETHGGRFNLSGTDVTDFEYLQLSAVPRDSESHGGDDVAIYAIGPMAHLFHGLHEQNYIAHAMAYAACIGANTDHCSGGAVAKEGGVVAWVAALLVLVFSRRAYH